MPSATSKRAMANPWWTGHQRRFVFKLEIHDDQEHEGNDLMMEPVIDRGSSRWTFSANLDRFGGIDEQLAFN